MKETDNMQQLYHKTCGFCDKFCGNAWCPIIGINKKRKEDMSEEGQDYMDFVKETNKIPDVIDVGDIVL